MDDGWQQSLIQVSTCTTSRVVRKFFRFHRRGSVPFHRMGNTLRHGTTGRKLTRWHRMRMPFPSGNWMAKRHSPSLLLSLAKRNNCQRPETNSSWAMMESHSYSSNVPAPRLLISKWPRTWMAPRNLYSGDTGSRQSVPGRRTAESSPAQRRAAVSTCD